MNQNSNTNNLTYLLIALCLNQTYKRIKKDCLNKKQTAKQIIMRRILMLLTMLFVFEAIVAQGQVRQVSGIVISSGDKQPIPGASVFVKEAPTVGTVTDVNGRFVLKNLPANAKTLVFRFVGYTGLEMPVGSDVVAELQSENQKIEEVVVTAYGTVKKSSMTSSASTVGSKELASRPVGNAVKALEGQAAGVQVTPGYGAPGSAPSIRIRGFGSINASSEPLYVVDGIPYDSSISNINSDDIETMTVLKDAAATSLYGSRAANGVVIITTKKGKNEQFTVNAKASFGISQRGIPEYDRIGVLDYYPTIWRAIKNGNSWGETAYTASNNTVWKPGLLPSTGAGSEANATIAARDRLIQSVLKYNILTVDGINQMNPAEIVGADGKINPNARILSGYNDLDWFKELTRLGERQDYSVSASGGSNKSDYFLSVGYLKEDGYVLKSDYERITSRSTINIKPTSWLKFGTNISGTVIKSNSISGSSDNSSAYINPFSFARYIGPIYPVYLHDPATGNLVLDENGEKQYDMAQNGLNRGSGGSAGRHVLAEMMLNSYGYETNILDSKANAEIILPYGFKLSTNGGVLYRNYREHEYNNTVIGDGAPGGSLSQIYTKTSSVTFNQLLTWNRSFNNHSVDVLVGHEMYSYLYNYIDGSKNGQIVSKTITEFPNFTDLSGLRSKTDKDKLESYLSRVNYNYAEKYFVSGSYRRDGSSRFQKDSRWGNFFSASLAWNAGREEFIKSLPWVNDLKVRASYGETGNNNISIKGTSSYVEVGGGSNLSSYYPYQDLYELGYNNGMNSTGGILQSTDLANLNITWETNKQSNIALDFRFLDRISGSLEWFNRKSDNLLFNVPLPLSTGRVSQPQNIGSMRNRGVEITLAGTILDMKDGLSWNLSVNATSFKNRITKMPPESPTVQITRRLLAVGHSIYDFYLRQWGGVDSRDGSGLYVYDSALGDAAFNEAGRPYVFRTINGQKFTTDPNYAKFDFCGSAIPDVLGGITNTFAYKGFSLNVLLAYSLGGKAYDGAYASLMTYGAGSALHPDILKSWQYPGDGSNIPRIDITKNELLTAPSSRWLVSSDYLALKNITLGYTFPSRWVQKVGIKGLSTYFSGDNLGLITKRKGLNPQQDFDGITLNTYVMSKVYTFGVNVTL